MEIIGDLAFAAFIVSGFWALGCECSERIEEMFK